MSQLQRLTSAKQRPAAASYCRRPLVSLLKLQLQQQQKQLPTHLGGRQLLDPCEMSSSEVPDSQRHFLSNRDFIF